jgi:hypothetical protein
MQKKKKISLNEEGGLGVLQEWNFSRGKPSKTSTKPRKKN